MAEGAADKKSPGFKPGPSCQAVRGVGETRETAQHSINVRSAEWFPEFFIAAAVQRARVLRRIVAYDGQEAHWSRGERDAVGFLPPGSPAQEIENP